MVRLQVFLLTALNLMYICKVRLRVISDENMFFDDIGIDFANEVNQPKRGIH